MKIALPTGMSAWMFQLTYGSLNWKPVSSTNGSHVGGTGGGLDASGVLDAPCTVLADGLPSVWGKIWVMNVSDNTFRGGPIVVNCLVFKELFNWVSKIIRECIGFALLRSMIRLKNSATLSLAIWCITYTYHDPRSPTFSRAVGELFVFTLISLALQGIFISSHWLL